MTVELAVLDLNRRLAVLSAADDGDPTFPHALRGALAAMLAVPSWSVVVAFDPTTTPPLRPRVSEVVSQAGHWAAERDCLLAVTFGGVTSPSAASEP